MSTRVALNEQRIDNHERECAERYEGIEEMFKLLRNDLRERFDGIDRVLGRTEDEGLRAKVAGLKSLADQGKAVWWALATVGGIACAAVGWAISIFL